MWEHFLVYPQGKKGLEGQFFQDSQGFKGSMFQWYRRSKGFRVSRDRGLTLLARAFKKFGVSKIQGFQGKYIKFELGQKYHRKCIVKSYLRPDLFMGKTGPTGKCTPRREDIFKYGN